MESYALEPILIEKKDASESRKEVEGITLPPWSTPILWEEINQSIAAHLCLYHDRLKRARAYARLIQRDFWRIYPQMEILCAKTCPTCRQTCCQTAKPYYDFRDLIYLNLCGLKPPHAQPIGRMGESCRYLRPSGCDLARERRPWICTWYLCPEQNALLYYDAYAKCRIVKSALLRIKKHRKILEDEFINRVAEGIRPARDGMLEPV